MSFDVDLLHHNNGTDPKDISTIVQMDYKHGYFTCPLLCQSVSWKRTGYIFAYSMSRNSTAEGLFLAVNS